ncbi:hypothetical protein ACJX0J_027416 [Zea mays]
MTKIISSFGPNMDLINACVKTHTGRRRQVIIDQFVGIQNTLLAASVDIVNKDSHSWMYIYCESNLFLIYYCDAGTPNVFLFKKRMRKIVIALKIRQITGVAALFIAHRDIVAR